MIPIFKAGDPLSAGKFNALGDSIRHLSENVSTAGEMMVPQHFDALPQPEMDFSVLYRKDDAGAWGWCCHQGRVIVKGKEYVVGEKEWTLIAGDTYTGGIKLVVTLDDAGEFSSGVVQEGTAAEGSGTSLEFSLATIGEELVWQHAGGPVYIIRPDEIVIKAGKGIQAEEEEENGENGNKIKTWKISALIEDAKEPSSADCSLIYKEKEDGGDADGDPYKLKLLCSSDGSVNIEDKEGKLSLSAQKVEPGDGLEWKKGQDQDGNDIDTQILQIKIDSTAVESKTPGENGKWPLDLSVSPEGLAGELDLTVDTSVHDLGGGAKVGLSTEAGALSLIVTPGGAAEELSFRAPLRKNGKYVVLDYESSWSDAVNGVKAGLFIRNNKLAVELYAETAPDGSDSLISDSWTVLFCDSDHAIRLHRDENGKIYIQQGEWIVTSKIYAPIN
ncbi:hypothetical protein [uncultured Akkermansia sp.]|uniref:hypothetical protein n=1 Tax=uncultured Akkermansia sp. TaxID=512294 RepID=UPI002639EEDB|nr:hypothetical protein [uncultured Akkermansia sp.]